ncbi:hypothetical protein [uncultured Agrobacterium sp.]|uniref:hypothetical protein n=1 Tax=uncultured Agrobacterium sp. TaxID=157277 RepID=UPI0025F51F9E|nr:hypothetical protein [uncultured Agrobacterium sp.]
MVGNTETQARRGRLRKLIAGAGGLVAAGLSLGYSMYERRESELVPVVEAKKTIDAGRWQVALESARIIALTPNGLKVTPGKQAVAVEMRLENLSAESSNIYGDLIKLDNIKDAPRPAFYLDRDRDLLGDLQPVMPEMVTAVWELPADGPVPSSLDLSVQGEAFRPRDNLYAAPGWFPKGAVARVVLPLSGGASVEGAP